MIAVSIYHSCSYQCVTSKRHKVKHSRPNTMSILLSLRWCKDAQLESWNVELVPVTLNYKVFILFLCSQPLSAVELFISTAAVHVRLSTWPHLRADVRPVLRKGYINPHCTVQPVKHIQRLSSYDFLTYAYSRCICLSGKHDWLLWWQQRGSSALERRIWKSNIRLETKIHLYHTYIVSVSMYGCETWATTKYLHSHLTWICWRGGSGSQASGWKPRYASVRHTLSQFWCICTLILMHLTHGLYIRS